MPKFTDTAGREWPVALNVATVKRIRDGAGLDVLKLAEQKTLVQLLDDPCKLAEVLWCVIEPEANKREISPEDFGSALAGDCLEAATDCLLEALCDFFPKRRADILRGLLQKARRVGELQLEMAEQKLAGLDANDLWEKVQQSRTSGS